MQKGRNYGVDILRGIALILISIYHYYQFQGTYIGVVVFFALSGYLVTDSLLGEDFQCQEYWKKKVKKLYPLLLFVVIVSTLFVFYLEKGLSSTYRYGAISSIFALSNVYQAYSKISYFESHGEVLPLVHTWALSLEIQFYIAYPLLLTFLKKMKRNAKEVAGVLFVLSLLSMFCMAFQYIDGKDLSRIYYGTDTRLFSFLFAASLASFTKEKEITEKAFVKFFAFCGLFSIFFFSFFIDYTSASNYLGGLYLASVFVSYTILACLQMDFLEKINVYPAKILAHLGQHGYSYYLWQYVIMIFANEYFKWVKISYHLTVLLQVILLIGISEASYIWIEKRKFVWKEITALFIIAMGLLIVIPSPAEKEEDLMEQAIESLDSGKKEKLAFSDQIEESLSYGEEQARVPVEKNIEEGQGELVQAEGAPEEQADEKVEGLARVVYPEQITFIGDSVMKMCEADLQKDFPKAYIDAAVSRQFLKLPGIIEDIQKKGKLYPVVVIHLGSNGPIREKSFQKVMEMLEGHRVFFVNAVVSKAWETEVNHLLEEKTAEYEDVSIVDWYQFAKGKSKWFYKDATHPKPNGAKKYSDFILTEILKTEIGTKKE